MARAALKVVCKGYTRKKHYSRDPGGDGKPADQSWRLGGKSGMPRTLAATPGEGQVISTPGIVSTL